ncbi:uncharacterized protein ISCGN_029792 [Ixodes scapularis]
MYVYVRYLLDNETAIMPVKFVKNFSPKSNKDLPTNPVQAYWRSEAYGEAYYEATVLLMGESKAALLEEMSHKNRMIIPHIFEDRREASPSPSASSSPCKKLRQHEATARKRQLTCLLGKRKLGSTTEDDIPEVVPMADLDRAQETIRSLREKLCRAEEPKVCPTCAEGVVEAKLQEALATIEQLRAKLSEEQHTNFRLTRAVLDQIEIAREASLQSTPAPQGQAAAVTASVSVPVPGPSMHTGKSRPQPTAAHRGNALAVAASVLVPGAGTKSQGDAANAPESSSLEEAATRVPPLGSMTEPTVPEPPGSSPAENRSPRSLEVDGDDEVAPAEPHGAARAAGCGEAGDSPPLLAVRDGKVHLGHGIMVPEATLNYAAAKATTPGRFLRIISRRLWKPEELYNRSVSGQPCRSHLKHGAVGKAPLTPEKIDALTVAFSRCPKRAPKKDKKEGGKQGQKKPARELSVKKVVKKLMGDFMVEKNRSAEKAQGMQKKAPSHCLDAEEDM